MLDERGRRWFAAAEALAAGRGGVVAVARITGIARSTIGRGLAELRGEAEPKAAPGSTALGTTDRLVIDGNGNVGIGTTSPTAILDVENTNFNIARFFRNDSTQNAVIEFGNAVGSIYFGATAGNADFGISIDPNLGANAHLIVKRNGNVGIGTTTPWGKLSIKGTGTGTGKALVITDSSNVERMVVQDNGNVGIGTTNPDQGKVEVKGGTVCVDTDSDNNATSCIASESDERLKTNITSISASSSLETILALNPVSFDWRASDMEILKHILCWAGLLLPLIPSGSSRNKSRRSYRRR